MNLYLLYLTGQKALIRDPEIIFLLHSPPCFSKSFLELLKNFFNEKHFREVFLKLSVLKNSVSNEYTIYFRFQR